MDVTAESFKITLSNIASAAQRLELLPSGVTLEYRHNGAGHPPYVYAKDSEGATIHGGDARDLDAFLPQFTYKFSKRESMAALEACQRALECVAFVQNR